MYCMLDCDNVADSRKKACLDSSTRHVSVFISYSYLLFV